MQDLIKNIEEKKQKLDSYRPLPKELVKNLNEWFAVELTYTSNAIEGNTLTRQETALVVEKGLTIGGKSLKEHLEARNHIIALDYIKTLASKNKKDISLTDILNIHQLILKGIDDDNAGKWRKVAVKIAGSSATLPSPLKVPELMDDFISWLHKTTENSLFMAADAHLKLVIIHPFVDGNGRTARLLMNLLLIQSGYPSAIIAKEDRSAYIKAIEKAETTGDLQDFYSIIFKAIEKSLDIYLQAAQETIK